MLNLYNDNQNLFLKMNKVQIKKDGGDFIK